MKRATTIRLKRKTEQNIFALQHSEKLLPEERLLGPETGKICL